MKGKLLMYAFVFVLLLLIFQYVNSKHIFESYQQKMTQRIEMEQVLKDSIQKLNLKLKEIEVQIERHEEDQLRPI